MLLIPRGYWLVDIERPDAIAVQGRIVDWHALQPLSVGTEARIDAQQVIVPLTLAHVLLGCFVASHVPRQAARAGGSGNGNHQDGCENCPKILEHLFSPFCLYVRAKEGLSWALSNCCTDPSGNRCAPSRDRFNQICV